MVRQGGFDLTLIVFPKQAGKTRPYKPFLLSPHLPISPSPHLPMRLRFSEDIKSLLERLAENPLTLGDILAETAERGFSLTIGLLVLPFLFPNLPGLTGLPGSACLLLAGQMAMGRRSPWLPKKIAQFRFPNWLALRLLNNLQRLTGILEKIVRPRMRRIAEHPYIWRLNGVCIAWLAILLILPIPFTNPIPTVGILLLAIATLEADGLMMCVAYGMTLAITAAVLGIAYALWLSPNLIQRLFN